MGTEINFSTLKKITMQKPMTWRLPCYLTVQDTVGSDGRLATLKRIWGRLSYGNESFCPRVSLEFENPEFLWEVTQLFHVTLISLKILPMHTKHISRLYCLILEWKCQFATCERNWVTFIIPGLIRPESRFGHYEIH